MSIWSLVKTNVVNRNVSMQNRISLLGCLIPPLLFQTYFASILFGHLWFQDIQNIIFFAEKYFLRSPQDPPKSEKVDFQVAPITLLMVLLTCAMRRWWLMKRNQIDPSAQYRENVQNLPKYPYFCLIWQLLKITYILARFGRFLCTERSNQINSFSWAISVSWHKFRVPSTG